MVSSTSRDMRVRELVDIYEPEMLAGPNSDQTKRNELSKLRTIRSGIGELRHAECTPGRLDAFIHAVAKQYPGAARSLRSILKKIMVLAVLHGVFETNPVAEVRAVRRARPDVTALGAKDLHAIRLLLQRWDSALLWGKHPRNGSLTDATDVYTATAARTSEVLALYFDDFSIDQALMPEGAREPATVDISKTVVRNLQNKHVVQPHPHPKTSESVRRLELPYEIVPMLMQRRISAKVGLVFPSEVGTVRSPDAFRRDWHSALKSSPYEGLTPGLYRKSVATLIAHTLGEREAAEQLGHTGLGNLKHYVEKKRRGPQVAALLSELFSENRQ